MPIIRSLHGLEPKLDLNQYAGPDTRLVFMLVIAFGLKEIDTQKIKNKFFAR